MCLIYIAWAFLQRRGSPFKLGAFQELIPELILNEIVLNRSTMDPEAVQDPVEAPTPAPAPLTMQRSLSSESGSNSSLSTVYFEKKSGSAGSSHSESAASTSRSPPDQEVAARILSWPSPPFGQAEGHGEDDPSSLKVVVQSPEEKIDSKLVTKADSTGAYEHPPPESKTVIQELEKSSDTIVKEFRHTESIMIKEAEQAAESCCSCCRPCAGCCRSVGSWGFCGDVAAVLCCPFTVISLLSCICFKCPKLFATKTADRVKSTKSRGGKGDQRYTNRETSELEESKRTIVSEASHHAVVKHKEGHEHHHDKGKGPHSHSEKHEGHEHHHDESKGPHSHSEKKDSPVGTHQNYFFPSPTDDRDKSGGR